VRVYSKDDIMAQLRRNSERSAELDLERQKALIRAESHTLVWKGSPEELTATITRWFESGYIDAYNLEDALHKASIHFVRHDGSPALLFPAVVPQSSQAPHGDTNPRRAVIQPLLEKRGWSILDWANEAGVSYHAASDYLVGSRHSYPSTRAKLAKALGVSVQQLPK
jgi:lambda repressor-like predicted transcriptional regulator